MMSPSGPRNPVSTSASPPPLPVEPVEEAPDKPLPKAIRWLLVIPVAFAGALGMALISVLIVLFSGVADGVDDLGIIAKFILVFMVLSCPMASINVGAGQAPGHKERAALVLAVLWAIGLTLALLYVAAGGGISGAGDWLLLGACVFAGINGVVFGYYYARSEGEASK